MEYLAVAVALLVSIIELLKDRPKDGEPQGGRRVKQVLLVLAIIAACISCNKIRQDAQESASDRADMKALKTTISARDKAIDANVKAIADRDGTIRTQIETHNAERKQFIDKVVELGQKVKSEELLAELGKTQKALEPPRPVHCAIGFWRAGGVPPIPTETSADLREGSVKVKLVLMNVSDQPARNVQWWVRPCRSCAVVSTGKGWVQDSDQPEDRRMTVGNVSADTAFLPQEFEVITPGPGKAVRFAINVKYACDNCAAEGWKTIYVNPVVK